MPWCKNFCFIFDDIEAGEFSLGWLQSNQTGKLSQNDVDKLSVNENDKLVEKDR